MTFSRSRFEPGAYELLRFATALNTHVVGAAGKLLKRFTTEHLGEKLVTFSHNDWGLTNFYQKLGFALIHLGSPGYTYINFNSSKGRESRLKYQKHKIATEENKHLTEKQIMKDIGFERIYDCGSSKWLMIM